MLIKVNQTYKKVCKRIDHLMIYYNLKLKRMTEKQNRMTKTHLCSILQCKLFLKFVLCLKVVLFVGTLH